MITVSVPGKIHLLGEHAVVYGKPALLGAVNLRLYVTLEEKKGNKEKTSLKKQDKIIQESIAVFQKAFHLEKLPEFTLKISSQIPLGCGVGSSASLAAGVIAVLIKQYQKIWNPLKINELAYRVEKITHGNPSGADNTTVVFGGLVWYRKEFEFLKNIWSLPIAAYKIPPFYLVNSGKPEETTKEMVEKVAKFYHDQEKKAQLLFADQELQTKRLLLALRNKNEKELMDSLKAGERNLERMGVVGRVAQTIIRKMEKLGAAAKICGAGGQKRGSGMILIYHPQKEKLAHLKKELNLPLFKVKLGEEGIRIEKMIN